MEHTGNIDPAIKRSIENHIFNFINSSLTFYEFPSSFYANERRYIHVLCRRHGIKSKSSGSKSNRKLRIEKPDIDEKQQSKIPELLPQNQEHLHRNHNRNIDTIRNYKSCSTTSTNQKAGLGHVGVNEGHFGGNNWETASGKLNLKEKPHIPRHPNWKNGHHPYPELIKFRNNLPVARKRNEILESINDFEVTLIVGDTGSGKTTQIPQYILENASEKNDPCRIFFSQPRRLAAISGAQRIADERGQELGIDIGYQVRLESRNSSTTNCILCTHGVLLRTLMGSKTSNGDSVANITHIILDEVHERDKFADFLLIELRRMINSKKLDKLIIMSATIDLNFFIDYFVKGNIKPNVISIEGRTGVVDRLFLDDIFTQIPECGHHIREKLKSRKREQYLCNTMDEMQDVKPQRKKSIEEESFNADIDTILDRISDLLRNQVNRLKIKPLFEELEIFFSGVPASQSQKNRHGENALNLAVRTGLKIYVEKYINRSDDFAVINETDGSGRNCITWAKFCIQNERQSHMKAEYEDILEFLEDHVEPDDDLADDDAIDESCHEIIDYEKTFNKDIDNELICWLVKHIWLNDGSRSKGGSILIFLPGFHEIRQLGTDLSNFFYEQRIGELLEEHTKYKQKNLFFLHSQISPDIQKEVFTVKGRKIILSTNIAETSLTIPDIDFVIDCGKQRMKLYEPGSQISMWSDVQISQSSSKQRAGRCGRIPGTYGQAYHLYTRTCFDQMDSEQMPELLRMPIHELCLSSKLLAAQNESIEGFLSLAPDPPKPHALKNAIQLLIEIGALDDEENLTNLGHQLVDLPIEPRLGKTVLAAVVLKCLDPILTIVCSLSYRDPFIHPTTDPERRNLKELKRGFFSLECDSDHITLVKAYRVWQDSRNGSRRRNKEPSDYLSSATMFYIKNLRQQLLGQLRAAGFVRNGQKGGFKSDEFGSIKDCNVNSDKWSVVKSALVVGSYPNLARAVEEGKTKVLKVISTAENNYLIDSQSVCSRTLKQRTQKYYWFIFEEIFQQHRGRLPMLKSVTPTTPISIALFAGSNDNLEIIKLRKFDHLRNNDDLNSDSEYDDIRSDLKNRNSFKNSADDGTVVLKWKSVDIEFTNSSIDVLHGIKRIRADWNNLFEARLQPRNYKFKNTDESIIRQIVEILITEDDYWLIPSVVKDLGEKPIVNQNGGHRSSMSDQRMNENDSNGSSRSEYRNNQMTSTIESTWVPQMEIGNPHQHQAYYHQEQVVIPESKRYYPSSQLWRPNNNQHLYQTQHYQYRNHQPPAQMNISMDEINSVTYEMNHHHPFASQLPSDNIAFNPYSSSFQNQETIYYNSNPYSYIHEQRTAYRFGKNY